MTTDASTWAFEIQNLRRFGEAQIVSGLGYIEEDDDFDFEQANITSKAANLYVYGQWKLTEHDLSIQAGLAAELFDLTNSLFPNSIERSRLSPKLGVVWTPRTGTTLRAAAFSSVRRPFIRSQTIEPTQVAGSTSSSRVSNSFLVIVRARYRIESESRWIKHCPGRQRRVSRWRDGASRSLH